MVEARHPQPGRTPFVGRGPELAALTRRLEAAERGQGSIALLVGEPGIGKTRTAEELCEIAEQHGSGVYWGACFEGDGAPAFWPWIQVVRGLISSHGAASLRARLGPEAARVAQIVPELHARLPDLPEPPSVEPLQARYLLFDGVVSLLRALATRPLVLVLDDLHWADEASLLLLDFLAERLVDAPILVIVIYRDVEGDANRALSLTLSSLARRPEIERIALQRLSLTEVARFVTATPGVDAAAMLARTVLERAEGNPLFVGEMLRLLQDDGAGATLDESTAAGIPPTIRATIGRRLDKLSETCRRVLAMAAVVGRDFDLPTLQAASPTDQAQTLAALDEAAAVRIVVPVPGSGVPARFRFTHALVRDTLYEGLETDRRAHLHLQVGTALEHLPGSPADARQSELAHHFVQAASLSPPEQVVQHVRRAAERAARVLAYEEAARLYRLALDVLDARPSDDPETRCELLLRIGTLQAWLTDDEASRASFVAAADLARHLDARIGSERAAHLLTRAALGYCGGGRQENRAPDARGIGLLEEALAAVGEEDSADRALLLARLGSSWSWPVDPKTIATASYGAISVARRVGDPLALAGTLTARYYAMTIAESRHEVKALSEEVAVLADQLDDASLLMNSKRWLLKYLLEIGDLPAADAVLAEYGAIMRGLRYPYTEWRLAVARMSRALLVGDLAVADQAAEEAVRLGPSQPRAGMPWYVAGRFHLLRVEQGHLDEAERLLDELRLDYPRQHGPRLARAWIVSERGRLDEAGAELAAVARNDHVELHTGGRWNYSLGFLAQLSANLGDRRQAALLYDLLLPQAGFNIVSGVTFASYGAADYHLARLAATMGRPWNVAGRHFEDAIRLHERLRARPLLARTRYHYAAAIEAGQAAGPPRTMCGSRPASWLGSHSTPLRRWGWLSGANVPPRCSPGSTPRHAPRPRPRPLPGPVRGARPDAHLPEGLTDREVEVLALLATGATNAEIARTLIISPGTVHWYTVKIYQKLGVRGRAEAAAYASQRGLTVRPVAAS